MLAVRGADPGRHERHGNGHRRIGEINTDGDWQTVITTEQNRRLQKMFASWIRPEHADTPKIPALSGLPFNRSPSYRCRWTWPSYGSCRHRGTRLDDGSGARPAPGGRVCRVLAYRLIEALEDSDDVQDVYANYSVSDAGLRPIDVGPPRRARQREHLGFLHIALQQPHDLGFGSAIGPHP